MTQDILPSLRALGILAMMFSAITLAVAQTSSLPGGASSLNETYKDWRVTCVQNGTTKRCVLSQVQAQQNGQRVLAIELNAPNGNAVTGTLILPFGLALDSGVIFQIDEKPAMQPARFRTCLPAGCMVNVSLDAPTIVALRAGAALKVKATTDGGATASYSISLQGFGTALDRMGCSRVERSQIPAIRLRSTRCNQRMKESLSWRSTMTAMKRRLARTATRHVSTPSSFAVGRVRRRHRAPSQN